MLKNIENKIKYLHDFEVDEEMNGKLIKSLSLCFPHEEILKKQRFVKELPQHRWIIETDDEVAAHVALHEKIIIVKNDSEKIELRIGGIAEVFTHPGYRKLGFAKKLLNEAHAWMVFNNIKFSMLFGEAKIYSSSGYKMIENKIRYYDSKSKDWKTEQIEDARIKLLAEAELPRGIIDLRGPKF